MGKPNISIGIGSFLPYQLKNMKVYAFIGSSGTGKSFKAQAVAAENNIQCIIDDGLLIRGNIVLAGKSAKKAATKVQTVRDAIFSTKEEQEEMKKAFRKYKVKSLLILGTSDEMLNRIKTNLTLPEFSKIIRIEDVSSEEEMQMAKKIRKTQGKHVVPVPTFEIKKDFSGIILDPLQVFRTKKDKNPYPVADRSIIRPTFSYLGKFTISDSVFRDIVDMISETTEGIIATSKLRVDKIAVEEEGLKIYAEITVMYGYNIINIVDKFKNKIKEELENITAMNVLEVDVKVKDIVT